MANRSFSIGLLKEFQISIFGTILLCLIYSCSNSNTNNSQVDNSICEDKNRQKEIEDSINTKIKTEEEERRRLIEESKADSLANIEDSLKAMKVLDLMKKFKIKKDEFSNNIWYEHKSSPRFRNSNGFYFYFGVNEDLGVCALRMVLQYYDDDWLFIKNIIFSIDGENYQYVPEDMKRDNSGGYIWEWFDEAIDPQSDLVQALSNSHSVKIKLNGSDYYDIRTLNQRQIQAVKETYELYTLLKY